MISLQSLIERAARLNGESVATCYKGNERTWNTTAQRVGGLASSLQSLGLSPGDRIGILSLNSANYYEALFAIPWAGLCVVPLNTRWAVPENEYAISDSGTRVVLFDDAFTEQVSELRERVNSLEQCIFIGEGDCPTWALDAETLIRDHPVSTPSSRGGEEMAGVFYTGGTTGIAKGAMLSHQNILTNMMQLRARSALLIEDQIETLAAPLPLYHSYAFLLHCFAMPYAGNHNLLIPNPRDIKGMIKLFSRTPVNGFVGINTLYLGLLRDSSFEKLDFSALKFCGAGGMAMTTSVAEEWLDVTGVEIHEGYGLTECSPVVSVNIPGKSKLGTVGPVVPETEVRVVDEQENDAAEGATGELWIRGPQVMQGYWQQPEATRDVISRDGWFKTGDFAQIDDEGYIKIVDRKKDMILVSGFNVFPNEVEDWVNNHPCVLESAAIGVPNERSGEAVKLFVVLREQSVDPTEIIRHCRAGLTSYKVPKEVVFVEDLPKSIIGKILRRELR